MRKLIAFIIVLLFLISCSHRLTSDSKDEGYIVKDEVEIHMPIGEITPEPWGWWDYCCRYCDIDVQCPPCYKMRNCNKW